MPIITSMDRSIIVIAHNLRSILNVGSILRTSDGMGVSKVYCTGYTPYPSQPNDTRMPHVHQKITRQLHKTALGAEQSLDISHSHSLPPVLQQLKQAGYEIIAIEQANNSIELTKYAAPEKVALIVGREVEGIEDEVLQLADKIIELPMLGKKESYNVSIAAAIALYHCRFVT